MKRKHFFFLTFVTVTHLGNRLYPNINDCRRPYKNLIRVFTRSRVRKVLPFPHMDIHDIYGVVSGAFFRFPSSPLGTKCPCRFFRPMSSVSRRPSDVSRVSCVRRGSRTKNWSGDHLFCDYRFRLSVENNLISPWDTSVDA